jgi:hypothetical protein
MVLNLVKPSKKAVLSADYSKNAKEPYDNLEVDLLDT